jgi:DNA-binding transcriptional LysR family regulator
MSYTHILTTRLLICRTISNRNKEKFMRRKIPPLQTLVCFESAAKHESYTRAAQALSLTQSAVSRQISALEDYLGVLLFKRGRHGVALTEAGRKYATQIAPRLIGLEFDTRELMAPNAGADTLHIATVPTFATRWLIPRLANLRLKHPELTLHFDVRTRPFLFTETTFDAALFAGTDDQVNRWPGTQVVELMNEDVVPVASPALVNGRKRINPADLAKMPLLQSSTRPNAWVQWFDEAGITVNDAARGPRYELFSMLAMAARHGLGIALLPTILITNEIERGELVVLSKIRHSNHRKYYFVAPAQTVESKALVIFREWLVMQTGSANQLT